MKKTRVFELLNPTAEKWDIYEALIPALNSSYGHHCSLKVRGHLDRRRIDRLTNLLTIDFYAETEQDFYNIDYEAIKIYTNAGLVFKMLSTTNEIKLIEQQYSGQYQLVKQTENNWDLWMHVCGVLDLIQGKYGVKVSRTFYRKQFAMEYFCSFLNWQDFSDYTFECGRIVERNKLNVITCEKEDIFTAYQADLFDDIIDLTDTKRHKVKA
tara:strand:+ start:165 stop:797 length:633 start_codon:yes stop_codon:yes gene_type:complete